MCDNLPCFRIPSRTEKTQDHKQRSGEHKRDRQDPGNAIDAFFLIPADPFIFGLRVLLSHKRLLSKNAEKRLSIDPSVAFGFKNIILFSVSYR